MCIFQKSTVKESECRKPCFRWDQADEIEQQHIKDVALTGGKTIALMDYIILHMCV